MKFISIINFTCGGLVVILLISSVTFLVLRRNNEVDFVKNQFEQNQFFEKEDGHMFEFTTKVGGIEFAGNTTRSLNLLVLIRMVLIALIALSFVKIFIHIFRVI